MPCVCLQDGSEFAPQGIPEKGESDQQPCALRRSSSVDLGACPRLQSPLPPEPAGVRPSHLLTGSLDSLETQLRGLAPIDVTRRSAGCSPSCA